MGYCTSYSLSAEPIHKSEAVDPHRNKILDEEVKRCMDGDVGGECPDWYCYGRWYDAEQDMEELSRRFPEYLFELHGDGESSDDFWIEYFWNGKSQYCRGEVVYEEFHRELLLGDSA